MPNIVVLGAGIIGLSTAVNIQMEVPGSHVTVMAADFGRYTMSDGSAGSVLPAPMGLDKDTERRWCRSSCEYFTKLARSEEGPKCGVHFISGYELFTTPEPPTFQNYVVSCIPVSQATLQKLGFSYRYGYAVTSTIVDCRKYIPWLTERFLRNGGKTIQKKIECLSELLGAYDVVVNCTGLGSRDLVGDESVIPTKGHLLRVSAPWIKTYFRTSDGFGLFPFEGDVALGGIKDYGNADTTVSEETAKMILDKLTSIWPALKNVKILWEWVAIRPHRVPIRVEYETMTFGDRSLKVVHNYGHGSHGIGLSWGTAQQAATLVRDASIPQARL